VSGVHPSLAYLPSPHQGVWHLGAVPIRAYALCIIAGIIAAVWIGERRWVARGGRRGTVSDISVWAVVFGLVGGRLYHVVTDPELYFGEGSHPVDALKVWQGGLGIWGAIALGGVGAWIGCRRRGIKLPPFADAVAPGIAVAQAIGRWGNWFNQELFGRQTTLPWGLEIDPGRPNTVPGAQAYHPTFLYESLWDLGLAAALVWVDRRFRLGRGRVFALYVMGYTVGRVWIEALRIDTAHHFLGLRLNIWTSVVVFAGGLIYFLRHPGPREVEVEPAPGAEPAETEAVAVSTGAGEGAPAEATSAGTTSAGTTPAGTTAEEPPGATGAQPAEAPTAGEAAATEPAGSVESAVEGVSAAAGADWPDGARTWAAETGPEVGAAEEPVTAGAQPAEAPTAGEAATTEPAGSVESAVEGVSAAAGADRPDGARTWAAETGSEVGAAEEAAGEAAATEPAGSAEPVVEGAPAAAGADRPDSAEDAAVDRTGERDSSEPTSATADVRVSADTTQETPGPTGARPAEAVADGSATTEPAEAGGVDSVDSAAAQPLDTPASSANGPSAAGTAGDAAGTPQSGSPQPGEAQPGEAQSGKAQSEQATGVGSTRGEES